MIPHCKLFCGICPYLYVLRYWHGASIVKWIALDPCKGWSERDSKKYNIFTISRKKSQTLLIYKNKKFTFINLFKGKNTCILKDNTNGVPVGDIKQVIVNKKIKLWWNSIRMMIFFLTNQGCPQFTINSRNMKIIPISNYLRSWNSCPKPNLVICFWALILMKFFKDPILIFYIGVLNTTLEGTLDSKNPI